MFFVFLPLFKLNLLMLRASLMLSQTCCERLNIDCVAMHMYANLGKKWRGLQYRDVFRRSIKSSNKVDYNKNIKHMKELDVGAWEFLEKKDPKHFCRLFFKAYAKCDSVNNNMAEIFNAFIIDHRIKPMVTMLEDIFRSIMTMLHRRRRLLTV